QRFPLVEVVEPAAGELALDHVLQIADPLLEPVLRDVRADIGNGPLRVIDFEGVKLVAKVAAAGGPLVGKNRYVPWNLDVVLELMTQHRADGRMDQRGIRPVAGLDVVGGPFVIPLLAPDAANEGN